MDIRKIRKLIELIDETGIAEIEIKEGEESIRLSRTSSVAAQVPIPAPAVHAIAAPPQATVESKPVEQYKEGQKVCSPMVGTMYSSSSPEADPFIRLGQKVKTGDVLCIIEAMKMFNEIEAERDGVIAEIMVGNGEPVEYGQTLFIIK